MRNKYAGTCYKCGFTVEKGEGHFERSAGTWRLQHANHASKIIRGIVQGESRITVGCTCGWYGWKMFLKRFGMQLFCPKCNREFLL